MTGIRGMKAAWAAGIMTCAALLLFGTSSVKASKKTNRIPKGIQIQNTDVSGMTAEEAQAVVDNYMNEFRGVEITLAAKDKSITAKAGDLGLMARNNEVVEQAMNYGTTGNPAEQYIHQQTLKKGKNLKISFGMEEATLKQYLTDHNAEITTPAVNNGLTHTGGKFTYVKGKAGSTLEINKSVSRIEKYMNTKWDGKSAKLELPTVDVKPEGDEKQLKAVKDLLGTYTTDYSTSNAARKNNVARGAELLNGHILYPGETLSLYHTVAPLNASNGYETAGAYANGEVVSAEGGGICQVATTTYNAVLLSELAIENRAAHSLPVHYVEKSFDAAIASSTDGKEVLKNLEFKNNQEYPVYIEASTNGATITVSIYGKETRPGNRKVTYENHLVSETPVTNKYTVDPTLPAGTLTKTKSGDTGYKYQLIKIVTVDGVEQSRKVQNNSNYVSSQAEYQVGIASEDPAVTAAIQAAVASNDDATIMAAIQQATGVSVAPTSTNAANQLKALKDVAEANPDDAKAQEAYNNAKAASAPEAPAQ
ncbi:MAG: VanW family protein [Lachnospiraceae bacterium]|nr:VanW family protein [Lachnospiraceae bacterium]